MITDLTEDFLNFYYKMDYEFSLNIHDIEDAYLIKANFDEDLCNLGLNEYIYTEVINHKFFYTIYWKSTNKIDNHTLYSLLRLKGIK